jgi:hypothetical protein
VREGSGYIGLQKRFILRRFCCFIPWQALNFKIMSSSKNSLRAFLARGVDNNTAQRLVEQGYALQDLQLKTIEDLVRLGILLDQAKSLLDGSRPPIPDKTVIKILHYSKSVCCVCRDEKRGVIIHHINEWHASKSHDFANLALLCLIHHDEAHTSRRNTMTLTPERLKKLRDKWYEQVYTQDKVIITGQSNFGINDNVHQEINVDDVERLLLSIQSNTTIYLQKGSYNLSEIAKLKTNIHIKWKTGFNGYEPHISGIENLKIIGETGAEILIDPTYAWVMRFDNCRNLSFENITVGHTTPGGCTGGVFMFEACDEIKIKDCDLFGCGTHGITLKNSSGFTISRTIIRDCTYGIGEFFTARNVLFRDCKFLRCMEYGLLTINDFCKDINFLRCEFANNLVSSDYYHFIEIDTTCKEIVIEYSNIHDNEVSNWVNIPDIVTTRHNQYVNNKFIAPIDVWYYDDE